MWGERKSTWEPLTSGASPACKHGPVSAIEAITLALLLLGETWRELAIVAIYLPGSHHVPGAGP